MTDDRHERIRRRAHEIWEQAGRPEGSHMEHWEQATAEVDGDKKPKSAKKAAAAKAEKPKAAKAEKPAKAAKPAKAKAPAKPKAKG